MGRKPSALFLPVGSSLLRDPGEEYGLSHLELSALRIESWMALFITPPSLCMAGLFKMDLLKLTGLVCSQDRTLNCILS